MSYSMELQRIIGRLCHGGEITSSIQAIAPHHSAMALELQGRIAKLEAVAVAAQAVVDAREALGRGDCRVNEYTELVLADMAAHDALAAALLEGKL